jgi:hypothetical protein
VTKSWNIMSTAGCWRKILDKSEWLCADYASSFFLQGGKSC